MNFLLLLGIFILISLFAGILFNRIKLPRTTGYILVGFMISLIPPISKYARPQLHELTFYINEFAISILLFEFGLEITREHLRKLRGKASKAALIQSAITFALVYVASRFALKFDNLISLLLATFAVPTAPDIVMFVLKETRAKCEFTSFLEEIVLFDDIIAEFVFFLIFPFLKHSLSGYSTFVTLLNALSEIALSVIIGIAFGLIFTLIIAKFKARFQTFSLVTGFLLFETGISIALHAHSIIVLLISGLVFSFTSRYKKVAADVLSQYDVLLFILFLVVNGFSIDPSKFNIAHFAVLLLVSARFIGKMLGGITSLRMWADKFQSKLNLGFSLIPQSSITIYFVSHAKDYIGDVGGMIFNITMFGIIIFELVGAPLVKYAIIKESLYKKDQY